MKGENEIFFSLLEIPVLIEDAVVRQIGLVIGGDPLPVVEQGCRIVDIPLFIDKPDNGGDARGRLGDSLDGLQVCLDLPRHEKEALRRIPRDGKFREGDEVHPHFPRLSDGIDDLPGIAFDVAHRRVDLSESDSQVPHGFPLVR
jgi:hypothetical protein